MIIKEGLKEIWQNYVAHTKSSRFVIVIITLKISFIAALIHTFLPAFPFLPFAGIINGLGLGTYISKSFGAGEKERRINNWRKPNEKSKRSD